MTHARCLDCNLKLKDESAFRRDGVTLEFDNTGTIGVHGTTDEEVLWSAARLTGYEGFSEVLILAGGRCISACWRWDRQPRICGAYEWSASVSRVLRLLREAAVRA